MQILHILGAHPRIIKFKGGDAQQGLRLENPVNGNVAQNLHHASLSQKLKWSQQVAEAVAYIHSRGVLHCDIHTHNLLPFDAENVELADFQGRHLFPDRSMHLDGYPSENIKSWMLRHDANHTDQKTDISALGSAIYEIMQGHEPFLELDPRDDESEILARFESTRFPSLRPD